MEFVIRKNATLPLLKMQVVKDGRGTYEEFMSFIETSTIYFSMQNIDNGTVKINTSFAGFVEKTFVEPNATPEYYLYYRFSKKDTNKVGRFEGQFLLKNSLGTLVLPIREKLIIDIKDSLLDDDLDYDPCWTGKYQCCIIGPPNSAPTILELISYYSPGSINLTYILNSNRRLPYDLRVEFTDNINVLTGNTLQITTGVTINKSYLSGTTSVTINQDFNNLSRNNYFSNINISPTSSVYTFTITEESFYATPTPSPTNPCVQYLTDEFGNFLLTENGDYIISEINPCITPTPTPSPTNPCVQYLTDEFGNLLLTESGDFIISEINTCVSPTPTQTPTSTNTPTPSITPSITPSGTLTPTPSITPSITPS